MMKSGLPVALALTLSGFFAACGGSEEPPPDWAGGTPVASTGGTASRTPPFSELLLPLGAHQSREQLEAIAHFIRRWEQNPYVEVPENDTDMSTTAAMLAWVAESPDVHVTICPILSHLAQREGTGGDPGPALTPGYLFGMTAYLIEHPHAEPESREVQVAGMESGLRWYEAAVRAGVVTQNTFVDELLGRMRSEGGLLAWYGERRIRCGGGDEPSAPPAADGTPDAAPTSEPGVTQTQPTREEISSVFAAARPAVESCLPPGQMVQVRVTFRGSDGHPSAIEASGYPAAQDCVKAALETRLSLRPFSRAEYRVSYPYYRR
ncbi:MAG: hypothetical protein CMN30_07400 [Sandaracinus sp.]|nr:hypothetical protein [Sandaracinus sp.]